jgi:hypothetical protein
MTQVLSTSQISIKLKEEGEKNLNLMENIVSKNQLQQINLKKLPLVGSLHNKRTEISEKAFEFIQRKKRNKKNQNQEFKLLKNLCIHRKKLIS